VNHSGTIRGLDLQEQTPLNCSQNAKILDNGENNHCEWGMVSRDGWVVYEDAENYILDENDWWVPTSRSCSTSTPQTDVTNPQRSPNFPNGVHADTAKACGALCKSDSACQGWVWDSSGGALCWPLQSWSATTPASDRVFGDCAVRSQQNNDVHDLYGFFHGHDYFGAMADFVKVRLRM
jgi:hypothetical protein